MNTQSQLRNDSTAVRIPTDVNSGHSKLVYLSVATWESASADELCDRLRLDKGTVLSITKTLRERGHLEKSDGVYRLD